MTSQKIATLITDSSWPPALIHKTPPKIIKINKLLNKIAQLPKIVRIVKIAKITKNCPNQQIAKTAQMDKMTQIARNAFLIMIYKNMSHFRGCKFCVRTL